MYASPLLCEGGAYLQAYLNVDFETDETASL